MITREQFIEMARAWIGTPFHHQGRLKGVGVDCIGLAVELSKEAQVLTPRDVKGYGRLPHNGELLKALQDHLEEIDINDAKPGDLILLRIYKEPQHVAILTDIGILHAIEQGVVETSFDEMWQKRVIKAFRLPGVDD